MNDSFAKAVKRSKRIKSLPAGWIVPQSEWDSYYHHFTLRVKSLSDYICVINKLSQISDVPAFDRLVFRGHSDASSKYKLVPTIGRRTVLNDSCENSMVNEMLTLRPEEFDGITSNFDLLSKLQHFGLPTRILDFTYNPLIALYFACCGERKSDSRVICTYDTSSSYTSDLVEIICGMYKYTDYNAISLDTLIGGVSNLRRYANKTVEPLMAKPKYSNDRIKHQAAVFMIFPNTIRDYRSRMVVLGREHGNELDYRMGFTINEEENRRLEFIRKEPKIYDDTFRVDTTTLKKLFKHYKELYEDFDSESDFGINPKYHFLFQNRFSIFYTIQELSDETISQSFISILIEPKHRKRIMNDLATLGIDKAFVFPELEYTAEMVKNRFF